MKITKENYEEFALDFIEGNLNAADQKQFEAFLDTNPAIRKSIDDFQLVVLPAFTPIMPNKSKLYRNNSKIKPILLYIKSIAAVILVLILLSAVLIQIKKQPDKSLVQQQSEKQKMEDELPDKNIALEVKPEIKIDPTDDGLKTVTPKKSPGKSDLRNGEKKQSPIFSKTEIAEPIEEHVLVAPVEIEDLYIPVQTIARIETINIIPEIYIGYKIDHQPNFILFENEEIQDDPLSKIGRLLARANLIPTGLQQEIDETSILQKMIPETYVDLK